MNSPVSIVAVDTETSKIIANLFFQIKMHKKDHFVDADGSKAESLHIANIHVTEKYRGIGVGRRMYELLLSQFPHHHMSADVKFSNRKSANLHKSLGFRRERILSGIYDSEKEIAAEESMVPDAYKAGMARLLNRQAK